MKRIFLLISSLLLGLISGLALANIDDDFAKLSLEDRYDFLKKMPKSGELHSHLGGAVYAETLIKLSLHACLDKENKSIRLKPHCDKVTLETLRTNPKLYQNVIQAWSMKDFVADKQSGHDHFFQSFYKFFPLVPLNYSKVLTKVVKRALSQNENYLELMTNLDGGMPEQFAKLVRLNEGLEKNYQRLIHNKKFKKRVKHNAAFIQRAHLRMHREIDGDIVVRYQTYILREQTMPQMFAQAVEMFATAEASPLIVGINLVQAEDGELSLKNYKRQMQVMGFLSEKYPTVNIALHAGELSPALVSPLDISFHIEDALSIGKAKRIGHGSAIAHEKNSKKMLTRMREQDIAVEINLTSNEQILKINPQTTPLYLYLKSQVPVVLSTDDEGVLRTTLTHEYLKAATDYGLTYKTLKQINRNGLSYSFLPGHSLWRENNQAVPVEACAQSLKTMQLDKRCSQYIDNNFKAKRQWLLEEKLARFEKTYKK